MRNRILAVMLFWAALAISACGGGGGGDGGTPEPTNKTLVLKLGTQGTLPVGSKIGAIDNLTVTLPAGVVLPTDSSGSVLSTAFTVSGQISSTVDPQFVGTIFTPATSSKPASLTVKLVVPEGFDVGEFATVTCNISGSAPDAAEFVIDQATFRAKNLTDGADLTGLSATLTMSVI